jgi:hypothetical protein
MQNLAASIFGEITAPLKTNWAGTPFQHHAVFLEVKGAHSFYSQLWWTGGLRAAKNNVEQFCGERFGTVVLDYFRFPSVYMKQVCQAAGRIASASRMQKFSLLSAAQTPTRMHSVDCDEKAEDPEMEIEQYAVRLIARHICFSQPARHITSKPPTKVNPCRAGMYTPPAVLLACKELPTLLYNLISCPYWRTTEDE